MWGEDKHNKSSVLEGEEDKSDNVELSRDIQGSLSHPSPGFDRTVWQSILWSADNYKFKHSIIAIVSPSRLSIFLMAREHDNNSEPAFHHKRRVTWENRRIDYLNFGSSTHHTQRAKIWGTRQPSHWLFFSPLFRIQSSNDTLQRDYGQFEKSHIPTLGPTSWSNQSWQFLEATDCSLTRS